jgi:hypothetical protein
MTEQEQLRHVSDRKPSTAAEKGYRDPGKLRLASRFVGWLKESGDESAN